MKKVRDTLHELIERPLFAFVVLVASVGSKRIGGASLGWEQTSNMENYFAHISVPGLEPRFFCCLFSRLLSCARVVQYNNCERFFVLFGHQRASGLEILLACVRKSKAGKRWAIICIFNWHWSWLYNVTGYKLNFFSSQFLQLGDKHVCESCARWAIRNLFFLNRPAGFLIAMTKARAWTSCLIASCNAYVRWNPTRHIAAVRNQKPERSFFSLFIAFIRCNEDLWPTFLKEKWRCSSNYCLLQSCSDSNRHCPVAPLPG